MTKRQGKRPAELIRQLARVVIASRQDGGTVVAAVVGRESAGGHGGRLAASRALFFAKIAKVFAKKSDALADGNAVERCIGDEMAATAVVEGASRGKKEGTVGGKWLRIVMFEVNQSQPSII